VWTLLWPVTITFSAEITRFPLGFLRGGLSHWFSNSKIRWTKGWCRVVIYRGVR
jgi:hypothetical protein